MSNTAYHKYFLFITFKKISLVALNSKNQIFFTKEILVEDLSVHENFNSLEKFLSQNIFDIEKNLGKYVKDVFLINNTSLGSSLSNATNDVLSLFFTGRSLNE